MTVKHFLLKELERDIRSWWVFNKVIFDSINFV